MGTRCPSCSHRCLKQMAQDGLQPQDLFTSLSLCKEDQAAVLRALRKAEPTFSAPQPPLPASQLSSSPLLREIYNKVSPSLRPGTCRQRPAWGSSQGCPIPGQSPGAPALCSPSLGHPCLRAAVPAARRLSPPDLASAWLPQGPEAEGRSRKVQDEEGAATCAPAPGPQGHGRCRRASPAPSQQGKVWSVADRCPGRLFLWGSHLPTAQFTFKRVTAGSSRCPAQRGLTGTQPAGCKPAPL